MNPSMEKDRTNLPTFRAKNPAAEEAFSSTEVAGDQMASGNLDKIRDILFGAQTRDLRVSYEDMARLALGKSWIALTNNERQEFVSLFAQLLRDMLAGTIDDIADADVRYLSERWEQGFAEVRTKLVGPKIDTLIDFRLADKLGQWSVYDMVFDDASLVSNYHAQFTRIIRDHSYAGLVKKMKEKTLAVKAFETTTAP